MLSTVAGTPLRIDSSYSLFNNQIRDSSPPAKISLDDPLSPYMRAKRSLSRPKKPLSAYIYFSQD
jgi:hypothetical protein